MARQKLSTTGYWLASAGFLSLLFVPLFLYNMHQGLNHDEHQFVASAWLWKHEQLLPYRDYPYFHFPYLTFLNAWLFGLIPSNLLTARVVAQLSGWLVLVAVFVQTTIAWRSTARWPRFWLATAMTILLASTPLYMFTSGRAWNHDLATLLAVLSFLAYVQAFRSAELAEAMMLVSGLFLGLGIGVRLTLAPLIVPLVAGIWLLREGSPRGRLSWSLWFLLGGLLASIPLILVAVQNWDAFWFDNFTYPHLNTRFRAETGYARAMSLLGKVEFLARNILLAEPRNLILPAMYLAVGMAYPLSRFWSSQHVEAKTTALLLPFLVIAALAPTPAWQQYFFIVYPFLALGVMWGLRAFHERWVSHRWFWGCLSALLIINTALWWGEYRRELRLVGPDRWFTTEVQRIGEQIADLVKPNERVLTVSPIYVLEGNRSIFPELATGPFALRAAGFLPDAQRRQFGFIAPAEQLDSFFAQEAPRAILTGADPKDEAGIVEYALRHRYASLQLDERFTLWLQPRVAWDSKIELIAATVSPEVVRPGDSLSVMLFLRSVSPMARNYSVSVSLVGQDGSVLARQDGWPWGRPTSSWETGDLWFDGHELQVPPDVSPGIYAISVRLYDAESETILPITGQPDASSEATDYTAGFVSIGNGRPPTANAVSGEVRFGDHLRLVAYDWRVSEADAASSARDLTLIWEADGALTDGMKVFVHVIGANGELVAQQDQPPLAGFYPMSEWRPHQPVVDAYHLTLPGVLPEEPYTVVVGLYDPVTGERVPVMVDGRAGGDAYTLMAYP